MADFIDALQKQAKNRFGKTLSPSEVAAEFQKHDFEARIQHLDNLDAPEPSGLRAAAERLTYERALLDTHHRLRKIDR